MYVMQCRRFIWIIGTIKHQRAQHVQMTISMHAGAATVPCMPGLQTVSRALLDKSRVTRSFS